MPRKRDLEFELIVKEAAVDLTLQPEDGFILKVRAKEFIYRASTGHNAGSPISTRTLLHAKSHYSDI